jgi:hypothetical protein
MCTDEPTPADPKLTVRCFASLLDQLAQVIRGKCWRGHDHMRHLCQHSDDFECGCRIVAELLVDAVGRVKADRTEHQRVAIRGRVCDCHAADMSTGAGPVFYDHGLLVQLAESISNHPSLQIGTAAWAEGNNDLDLPLREVLGGGNAWC